MNKNNLKIVSLIFMPLALQAASHTNYNKLLISATVTGDLQQLSYALKNRANINANDIYIDTALFHAVLCGRKNVVKILIKAGANINSKNGHLNTPLISAVLQEHFYVTVELLKSKADLNVQGKFQSTALHHAIRRNNIKIFDALLKAGAIVDIKDCNKLTPLHWAIIQGQEYFILPLIKAGSVVGDKQKAKQLQTLLKIHKAKGVLLTYIFNNQMDKINRFLGSKQSLEIINYKFEYSNGTPLLFAACRGNSEIVKILFDYNNKFGELDFLAINQNNESALNLAELNNHQPVVDMFAQNSHQLANLINTLTQLPIPLVRLITKLLLGKNCIFK